MRVPSPNTGETRLTRAARSLSRPANAVLTVASASPPSNSPGTSAAARSVSGTVTSSDSLVNSVAID